jgi:hypothetical protein
MIAGIEWDRSLSNYVQKEPHQMTLNDINYHLSEQEKKLLNMALRQM